jgi:hypothetical protein
LFRDRDALWLGPAPGPEFPARVERWLEPPESLDCAERELGFSWRRLGRAADASPGWPVAKGERVRVRSPLPGDAIELRAGAEPRPLRALFARATWSRRRRARAVVVEHCGRVVWVPGLVCATPVADVRQAWKLVARRLSTPPGSC